MKNKRITCFALAFMATACMFSSIPAYAAAEYTDYYDFFAEDSCYIIDFLDYDGNLLDSKICAYGEKLTDVITPEPKEDKEYIYQFVAWDPQLSETVSECAAYMATYQRIRKDSLGDPNCTPEPNIQEQSTPSAQTTSDGFCPKEITQVSSTSHDVTRFTLETPTPKTEESDNTPVSADAIPKTEDAQKTPLPETDTPKPKPTDSPVMVKSPRQTKAIPNETTKPISQNTQTPTSQSLASKPNDSNTRHFSQIAFPVPLLFIGMAVCSGIARITGRRKHS